MCRETSLINTSAGGFVVENKTISRKHLLLEVDAVKPDDCVSHYPQPH
jgi:hypothetical protein